MRSFRGLLLACSLPVFACGRVEPAADAPPPAVVEAPRGLPALATSPPSSTRDDLVALLANVAGTPGAELRLDAAEYVLEPQVAADVACPACPGDDWKSARPPTTYGLRVSGQGIRIIGAGSGRTVVRTRSGVGIAFDGCRDCVLEGVTITGGERDPGDQAADAAISVRESSVTIRDCVVADNVGAEFIVQASFVGIDGVLVREGGVATIERCRILRSSWDGISVLRGGKVTVRDTVIDGVDRARALVIGGGRGVGVRIATGGEASIERSLIARHDGGVGAFGPSRVTLRESIIEDSPSWGLAAWGDESGAPEIVVTDVAVNRTIACAVTVRSTGDPVTGELSGLRLMLTVQGGAGVAADCMRDGIDAPASFPAKGTASWMTGGPREPSPADVDATLFRQLSGEQAARMAAMPALAGSSYVKSQALAASRDSLP